MSNATSKSLGLLELVAIALGGMVGGGIFTVLGISVAMVGVWTPLAIVLGGLLAALAAYSYVKLGVFYKDEGATYSFFKRTFPDHPVAASAIGWYIIFGYISTLSLYSYTFAAYVSGGMEVAHPHLLRSAIATTVLLLFAFINIVSVEGMGRLEDLMVYSKLVLLGVISFVLLSYGGGLSSLREQVGELPGVLAVTTVAALTFVAYEGFQLVINATDEMEDPERNIPRAIYTAIGLAILIYFVISLGALAAIPAQELIDNQEDALAAGAGSVVGTWGRVVVVLGAVLATLSAISGTMFGSSRQMAVVARDGFFPAALAVRGPNGIPKNAILAMAASAILLVFSGGLRVILEFGSITFLTVSLLMAYANHRIREQTDSSAVLTWAAMLGLAAGTVLILAYEIRNEPEQVGFILGIYVLLTIGALVASRNELRR